MHFSVTHMTDVVLIELEGDIWGGLEAMELRDAVAGMVEVGDVRYVVDLAETAMVNSAGIGALLATQSLVAAAGGVMKLCNVSQRTAKVLAISEVTGLFDIAPTREDAYRALGVRTD